MSVGSGTLVVALAPLEQSELGGIIDHSELLQQGLDDLAGGCARADVQVLGRVLWQVERGAALYFASLLPSAVRSFLGLRD